jgi:hypothetical protein
VNVSINIIVPIAGICLIDLYYIFVRHFIIFHVFSVFSVSTTSHCGSWLIHQ